MEAKTPRCKRTIEQLKGGDYKFVYTRLKRFPDT